MADGFGLIRASLSDSILAHLKKPKIGVVDMLIRLSGFAYSVFVVDL